MSGSLVVWDCIFGHHVAIIERLMTRRHLLLLLLVVMGIGPLHAQPQAEVSTPPTDSTQFAAVRAAALELEAEIRDGRPEALGEWFDSDAFLDRANEDRQIGALIMRELRRGFQDDNDLLSTIIDTIREGGDFRFLRVVERDGTLRARFRLLSATAGINYHDLLLVPDPSGTARFVDSYVFFSAEELSDTIGRLMEMMAAEGAVSPRLEALSEFFTLANAGRFREAWNAYPAEHIDAENLKALMLMRILVGMNVGDREYYEAQDAFVSTFPDDPSLSLILLDFQFSNRAFDALIQTVDRLEASVGGDPYLSVYRALAHIEIGDMKAALEAARQALKMEPALLVPNVAELRSLVALNRFDEAAAALRRMRTHGFDLDPLAIEAEPSNEAFVHSEPYLLWRKELGL